MIRWQKKGKERHPARTWLIRAGISMVAVSGIYLLCGIAGLVPLETETIVWNNLRLVAGVSILGCLVAAVGYGNE
jgi:hypothetical protein